MKSVISDNKIIPFLPCYKRTSQLHETKVSDLKTVYGWLNAKKCSVCRALFTPGSNRAKYCPECAARMKRINAAKRKRCLLYTSRCV